MPTTPWSPSPVGNPRCLTRERSTNTGQVLSAPRSHQTRGDSVITSPRPKVRSQIVDDRSNGMACPACGGQNRTVTGNGFRCTSQRVVNQVPSGMAGNPGPSPIPIFETCGYFYTSGEEQAAFKASWDAQQAAAAAAEAERERKDDLRQANWRAWERMRPTMIEAALKHSDPYERLVLCAQHWVRGDNPLSDRADSAPELRSQSHAPDGRRLRDRAVDRAGSGKSTSPSGRSTYAT